MITEEHITVATAHKLVLLGWEIIAVHAPDGQGPFTIPRAPKMRKIERSSYHPDIVAIKKDKDKKIKILIVECKVNQNDVNSDIEKIQNLTNSPDALYFICFRCHSFQGGPEIGVDFSKISESALNELPIEIGFAYLKSGAGLSLPYEINGFRVHNFSFSKSELLCMLNELKIKL